MLNLSMIKIINKIRLIFTSLTKIGPYSNTLIEMIYERHLNHHKVIHYRNGFPVYSNLLPALYSKPCASIINNLIFRVIQNRPLPSLMSIALTDICNAKCEHCSFFTSVDKKQKIMTKNEIQNLIKQAQDLGVAIINFVGGEPLMHPQIFEIIKMVDKRKSTINLFTNGWFLKEKAVLLKKSGLDSLYVSLDASDAKTHDKKRGLLGLFNRATDGIKSAKKAGLTVGISCCIDKNTFENGEFDKLIELSRQYKVNEVLVFDTLPVGRSCQRTDLSGHQKWIEKMIEHVGKYNQDKNYPGVLVYAYFASHMAAGCSGGTSYFYVSPYGEICPCDFYHHKFGNIKNEKLITIWGRMNNQLASNGAKWGGCRVKEITN